jgi:glycosyltransferase involved in cell wall biosynthesis
MRVLHIIVGLNVGGAELMLKRLIDADQSAQNHVHSVISLTEVGVIGMQLAQNGVEVSALGMTSAAEIPKILFKLVVYIRKSQPDVVQTWMYHSDLLGGLAARIAGNRNVIWGVRTTDVEAGGTRTTILIAHLCAALSRWIPRTIVCAAQASRRVHAGYGYDDARMIVIPNGFDLSRLSTTPEDRNMLRERCGFREEDLVVGVLGRFNPAKDHNTFVRAAGALATRCPNVRFLLVGRGLDQSNKELSQWIAATKCEDRFVLLGERSDVAVCLSAMDVFCLSSRTEGFPNVVGEAMAVGLPCVVTDVGDAAFLVGETGVVVPKENPMALAKGLEELVTMPPDRRAALGQRAKMRICAEFTIDRARERFNAVYRSISKK